MLLGSSNIELLRPKIQTGPCLARTCDGRSGILVERESKSRKHVLFGRQTNVCEVAHEDHPTPDVGLPCDDIGGSCIHFRVVVTRSWHREVCTPQLPD